MRYGDRYVDTRETEQGKKRSHYYIGSNLKRFITLPLILKVSIKHLRLKGQSHEIKVSFFWA